MSKVTALRIVLFVRYCESTKHESQWFTGLQL